MQISVLCSSGLAITHEGKALFVDVPNGKIEPFCEVHDSTWQKILNRVPPYDCVSGFVFTHAHPDHYSKSKMIDFVNCFPEIPVFLPNESMCGTVEIGLFTVSYQRIDHAPMDVPTPPHVVLWITAGDRSVYVAADAKLDTEAHKSFLKDRQADIAFWNSMYLSQPLTRQLLKDTGKRNYIYHMPESNPDGYGLWRKCEKNLQRFENELETVTVIGEYPYNIEVR